MSQHRAAKKWIGENQQHHQSRNQKAFAPDGIFKKYGRQQQGYEPYNRSEKEKEHF